MTSHAVSTKNDARKDEAPAGDERPLGIALYHEVKAWFVAEGKGRSLHGFLRELGYYQSDARDALTGSLRSERAARLRDLLRKETGIPIPVDTAA